MRPIPAPAFLCRLLLTLFGCTWGPTFAAPIWWSTSHVVHLYTASQYRSFHLQINPNGRVDATPGQTVYSAVIRKTLNLGGDIGIVGVKTRFYLCMHSNGDLYATLYFRDDCVFKSIYLKNHYEVFESIKHKYLVSLGSDKEKFGPKWRLPPFSQFLPRTNEIPFSQLE